MFFILQYTVSGVNVRPTKRRVKSTIDAGRASGHPSEPVIAVSSPVQPRPSAASTSTCTTSSPSASASTSTAGPSRKVSKAKILPTIIKTLSSIVSGRFQGYNIFVNIIPDGMY
jgi:hypothetical protein